MEATQGILLDTSVLFSKGFKNLLGKKLFINDSVILEYLNVMIDLRDEEREKGEIDRAKGREDQLRYFPQLVRENEIILGGNLSIDQLELATKLILERQVDPGDAIISIWTGDRRMEVATRDDDFDRLTDICSILKITV